MSLLTERTLIRAGATMERQYLTGLDVLASHAATACILVYPQGLDAAALKQSLATTLNAYPVLSGRLKRDARGHIFIDASDQGVPFIVKQHPGPLPPYGVARPMNQGIRQFFTRIYPWQVVDRPCPLMAIELHQFSDGGAVLSITPVHSACDGGALWVFLMDWVRAHHGGTLTPPVLDRNAVIRFGQENMHRPCEHPTVRVTPLLQRVVLYTRFAWQHVTQLDRVILRITPQQVQQWKDAAKAQLPEGTSVAAHDLAIAHCLRAWSAHLRARTPRAITVITDLRFRRQLGLARKFIGNALGRDLVTLSAQDLAQGSLTTLAQRCHIPLDRISQDELLGYLGYIESHRQRQTVGQLLSEGGKQLVEAGIIVNNCAHFPVYKMDFGQGPPSWHETERPPYRHLLLTPTPGMDGGFDVRLTARRSELAALRAT